MRFRDDVDDCLNPMKADEAKTIADANRPNSLAGIEHVYELIKEYAKAGNYSMPLHIERYVRYRQSQDVDDEAIANQLEGDGYFVERCGAGQYRISWR